MTVSTLERHVSSNPRVVFQRCGIPWGKFSGIPCSWNPTPAECHTPGIPRVSCLRSWQPFDEPQSTIAHARLHEYWARTLRDLASPALAGSNAALQSRAGGRFSETPLDLLSARHRMRNWLVPPWHAVARAFFCLPRASDTAHVDLTAMHIWEANNSYL